MFQTLDTIQVVAHYDYYGEYSDIENNLLFAECAKEDFRVELVEEEFKENTVEKIVFLSNLVGKI